MISPLEIIKRQLNFSTHKLSTLPIVILMPHSRCNCRCVMCDIWKANKNGTEISAEQLKPHMDTFRMLNVRWVTLSGGEALMHSNLWKLCKHLKLLGVYITLLSTGLLLERHVQEVIRWCDEVIVSLDGSREVHNTIRRIPNAYKRLAEGVAALRKHKSDFRVTGRCVLQRMNFRDLPNIITAAHELELDQISFLAADVSTTAFNRPEGWDGDRVGEVALSPEEVKEFNQIMDQTISRFSEDFKADFIAENPGKLKDIVQYFAALNGLVDFPETVCNAPWVSTVIEADGTVRPCFFHRSLGNIHNQPLENILNSERSRQFRRNLDVKQDPTCRKCVCTLNLGRRAEIPT